MAGKLQDLMSCAQKHNKQCGDTKVLGTVIGPQRGVSMYYQCFITSQNYLQKARLRKTYQVSFSFCAIESSSIENNGRQWIKIIKRYIGHSLKYMHVCV